MKKVSIIGLSSISLFCIVYYTLKYYTSKTLCFKENFILVWTIFALLTIFCLALGIFNFIKLEKINKQNEEFKTLLLKLIDQGDDNYYSVLHHLQNNREISLDILDEVQGGLK